MKLITPKDLYYLAVVALLVTIGRLRPGRARVLFLNGLSAVISRLSREKRRLTRKHVIQALGSELSEQDLQEIVHGAFREFWHGIFEWTYSGPDTTRQYQIVGIDHLKGAQSRGRGTILWESNGFGKRELSKRILHENGISIIQIHGSNNLGGFMADNLSPSWVRRSIIKKFFDDLENQFVREMIDLPSTNSLAFTRRLRELLEHNAILCVSGDGATGQRLLRRNFLGHEVLFSTGMVSLAHLCGATILPMFCHEDTSGMIRLTIEAPIRLGEKGDRNSRIESSIAQYAAVLEGYIRAYPEQYRRWYFLGEDPDPTVFRRFRSAPASPG